VALAVGDLNGDGRPDIVVANEGPNGDPGSVTVHLQDGAHPETFLSAVSYHGYQGPQCVTIADFDRDGRMDLLIGDDGPSVRLQTSTLGTFGSSIQLYY